MKPLDSVSDIQLNAYIDGELHQNDKMQVLYAIEHDPEIARHIADLRQDMDLLKLAYQNPPSPLIKPAPVRLLPRINRTRLSIAASIILVLGVTLGWNLSSLHLQQAKPAFTSVKKLPSQIAVTERVLIHISEMDDTRIRAALDKTEQLLTNATQNKSDLHLVVVANADGLGMLRKGSPYTNRIQGLKQKYPGLEFKACGIAMENARLKEGKEVELIPVAEKIPAALGEILQKIKAGWLYVKS